MQNVQPEESEERKKLTVGMTDEITSLKRSLSYLVCPNKKEFREKTKLLWEWMRQINEWPSSKICQPLSKIWGQDKIAMGMDV